MLRYAKIVAGCAAAILIAHAIPAAAQQFTPLPSQGGFVEAVRLNGKEARLARPLPLFTMLVDGQQVRSDGGQSARPDSIRFPSGLIASIRTDPAFTLGWRATLRLVNASDDTIQVENLVPFGASDDHPYITASGPWSLARTRLYLPGKSPIGVILPDNAWEMGYASIDLEDGRLIAAIARRTESDRSELTRWHTRLQPGGSVTYVIHAEIVAGDWRDALRHIFQDRFLYDLDTFDDSLYRREDLRWIRDAYVAVLQAAWDRNFYDADSGAYVLNAFLKEGEHLVGGYDIFALWPTWPRLGLDPRNQWDHYRDLPGGLEALRDLADRARARGTRFFISYNPWDQSTRQEDPYRGMAGLIDRIGVDGVVLDTRGSSSYELQAAADSVRPGVIMYSEGMAVPKDMPGIVSGRVHDAIRMPPPLNLNKLIHPQFSIFRVAQLAHETIHRDVATSFFNGYGLEINTFFPARPPETRDDFLFLGRAARVLRLNSEAFHSPDWMPLLPTEVDSIWVNAFPSNRKTIYTIYSLVPEGHSGPLFSLPDAGIAGTDGPFRGDVHADRHFVDVWSHREITPDTVEGRLLIPARLDAFDPASLGTQDEGRISAVASLPRILELSLAGDTLHVSAPEGDSLLIWAGNPSYQSEPVGLPAGRHEVLLYPNFGPHEGKFVVELLDDGELLDERIAYMPPGTARLIESATRTEPHTEAPPGMVHVPGGTISPTLEGNGANGTGIMNYPTRLAEGKPHRVDPFFIDRYPVTNADFKHFLDATGYVPDDTTNFLRHWANGRIPAGLENHPVVYVSLDDAKAYARWAHKRLPTEIEWQLAAQGTDGRLWPWGDAFDSTAVNVNVGSTTPVDAHPNGASPYGVEDLVGNVWQLTADLYIEGDYRFVMIRGGSFYNPTSSWWYMKNGPRPLNTHQVLLLVSPGFDRSATVGFRCVVDSRVD